MLDSLRAPKTLALDNRMKLNPVLSRVRTAAHVPKRPTKPGVCAREMSAIV